MEQALTPDRPVPAPVPRSVERSVEQPEQRIISVPVVPASVPSRSVFRTCSESIPSRSNRKKENK